MSDENNQVSDNAPSNNENQQPAQSFNFEEIMQSDQGKTFFNSWAEKTVALPLKRKNDELLREKQNLQAKFEELEKKFNASQGETQQEKGRYSKEELEALIKKSESDWQSQLNQKDEILNKRMGQLHNLMIDSQLQSLLTKAGVKGDSAELAMTFLKSTYPNGNPRIVLEETDSGFDVSVLDQEGRPMISGNGVMDLEGYVAKFRESHKDLFLAPPSSGSGASSSSHVGHNLAKMSMSEYIRLSPEQRAQIRPEQLTK